LLISHVITLVPFRVSSVDPSPVPKADRLSIANQSWARYKRGVSGWSWNIGQVLLRNFDWLPFTPPPSGHLLRSLDSITQRGDRLKPEWSFSIRALIQRIKQLEWVNRVVRKRDAPLFLSGQYIEAPVFLQYKHTKQDNLT
jgi:hypothetical protein